MPRYSLKMYDAGAASPATQHLTLTHDDDAMDMAEVALLSTADYTHVVVYGEEGVIGSVKRDGQTPGARPAG